MQVGVKGIVERTAHRLGFPTPQQAVVDENAGYLGPCCPNQNRGRHRGIDAAGQATYHALATDALA